MYAAGGEDTTTHPPMTRSFHHKPSPAEQNVPTKPLKKQASKRLAHFFFLM
jgi:hypothetical protein